MAGRFRVESRAQMDGSTSYYVLDDRVGGRPEAEFDDEQAALQHARELEEAAFDFNEHAERGGDSRGDQTGAPKHDTTNE